jgi:peptide/nickel transport system permease protein
VKSQVAEAQWTNKHFGLPASRSVQSRFLFYLKHWEFLVGIVIVASVVLVGLVGYRMAPYKHDEINIEKRFLPPSSPHWFGTDVLGRDILSRMLVGTRISLTVGAIVLVIALAVGGTLGGFAGYFGGFVDGVVMRVTEVFLAFPGLVLAMAVNAALGPSLFGAMVAISFVWWPGYARLVRGQVLALKQTAFVEAARALGNGDSRIIWKHILPHCLSPIIVKLTLDVGLVILTTAKLSFIGLGAQPPTPEWGAMVNEGRAFIIDQWWWSTFPGLAIMATVVGFNLLGDGLRDTLDPRLRKVGS